MRKILLFLVIFVGAFAAQAPIYVVPPATPSTKEQAKPTHPKKEKEELAAALSKKQSNEVMLISPELRAKDLKAAIEYLKQKVPSSKPSIKLNDGSTFSSILDVDVMPGGTILIFKIASLKGTAYKVVNIEEIESLGD